MPGKRPKKCSRDYLAGNLTPPVWLIHSSALGLCQAQVRILKVHSSTSTSCRPGGVYPNLSKSSSSSQYVMRGKGMLSLQGGGKRRPVVEWTVGMGDGGRGGGVGGSGIQRKCRCFYCPDGRHFPMTEGCGIESYRYHFQGRRRASCWANKKAFSHIDSGEAGLLTHSLLTVNIRGKQPLHKYNQLLLPPKSFPHFLPPTKWMLPIIIYILSSGKDLCEW